MNQDQLPQYDFTPERVTAIRETKNRLFSGKFRDFTEVSADSTGNWRAVCDCGVSWPWMAPELACTCPPNLDQGAEEVGRG